MGMAASQARFLGLTARKNNVEYEGQQINQQRTALSNQTASYYTDLLGMSVPQPPAVEDFTKTVYSFTDGALTNQITSLIAHAEGNFTVSYLRSFMDNNAIVASIPSRITRQVNDDDTSKYFVGGKELYALSSKDEAAITDADLADDVRNDEYWKSLSQDQRKNLLLEEKHYLGVLNEKYNQKDEDATWLVKYTQNTSTGVYVPTYYNQSVLDGAIYDETETSVSFIGTYTKGAAEVNEEIKGQKAFMEQDTTGRYINITLEDASGNLTTYALTTSTVTDDDAYNDAMNQYEYDKAQYDRSIQEINAKIEIIQSEDKNLELRLKQLDTEQDAISNEMDAVSKVVEKNVESSFKTFG